MQVAVLGATGVYARHLLPRLATAGFAVRALVRRPEAAGVARAIGADIRTADIFDERALAEALAGCDVCVNLATSLPGPSGRGDYAVNDRVRREGAPNLIRACQAAGTPRLLQQSIAWAVVRPEGDGVGDRAIQAALDMEAAVRASVLDWLILRGGLFYGPGTGFDDDWFARAAAGKLKLPGDGSGYVSLVHIADMAAATVAALRNWPSRQVLAVTDDEPATWAEVFGYLALAADAPPPEPGGRLGFPSFKVSNAKARDVLDWAPLYPSFRDGLIR